MCKLVLITDYRSAAVRTRFTAYNNELRIKNEPSNVTCVTAVFPRESGAVRVMILVNICGCTVIIKSPWSIRVKNCHRPRELIRFVLLFLPACLCFRLSSCRFHWLIVSIGFDCVTVCKSHTRKSDCFATNALSFVPHRYDWNNHFLFILSFHAQDKNPTENKH